MSSKLSDDHKAYCSFSLEYAFYFRYAVYYAVSLPVGKNLVLMHRQPLLYPHGPHTQSLCGENIVVKTVPHHYRFFSSTACHLKGLIKDSSFGL